MMDPTGYAEWLETRPERVRRLAAEFPMLSVVEVPEHGQAFVIGWTEDDKVILSKVSLEEDYDKALDGKFYCCAAHLRSLLASFPVLGDST